MTPGGSTSTFLDVSGEIVSGGEQGLLSIAFAPDYADSGLFYVDYTNRDGDTRVVEYRAEDGKVDPSSARTLLAVKQPFANHNGGLLLFGPDDMLYIGLGDGGGGGDPDRNGLDLGTLLGKILRIDPAPDGKSPYTVPDDNPFVDEPGARPEIYSYGLRNPWRFSFDSETEDFCDRRRRSGRNRGDRPRRARRGLRRELRLVRLRGRPTLQRGPGPRGCDPAGADGPPCRRQLLDHRRPDRP